MIVFIFLLLFFTSPAHAQEAAGEDAPGMRLKREHPDVETQPTQYIPSVPDTSKQTSTPTPTEENSIVPLESKELYIDSSRVLRFLVLNKQTGRAEEMKVTEGSRITHGSLTIRLIECWRSAPDAKPESASLLQVFENSPHPIFFGWAYASSPSLNPFEHPSYDIIVKECR